MAREAYINLKEMAASGSSIPSEAELLARARALLPRLIERAASTEAARSMDPCTIADFHEAGFFRIMQPVRWGGYGLSPLTLCRVIQELGRGDMSASWIAFVLGFHPYHVTIMGDEACRTVWGSNSRSLVASSLAPLGKMEKVDGGYRLNGTWRFSSGVDHADFAVVGGMVRVEGAERPDYIACVVPRSDYVIDMSSWNTFGLAGTGSRDFTIADAFVPDHLTKNLFEPPELHPDPALRYSCWVLGGATLASAVLGGALGAIDECRATLSVRKASFDSGKGRAEIADDPMVRARVGRAALQLDGAAYRIEVALRAMEEAMEAGKTLPAEERAIFNANWGMVGEVATEVVVSLFKTMGARGADLGSRYQSILRNVLVGANHIGLAVDGLTVNTGSILLGRGNSMLNC